MVGTSCEAPMSVLFARSLLKQRMSQQDLDRVSNPFHLQEQRKITYVDPRIMASISSPLGAVVRFS